MEIGDQGIQDFKTVARINENIGPACFCLQNAVLGRSRFHGTAAGSAHADHSSSRCFSVIHLFSLWFLYHIKLRMHMVIKDIFHLNRTEGAQAHMKGHMSNLNSHILNLL